MDTNGKQLGVLGLGNRSTLFYINALNTAFNNQKKGYSTFPFVLYNTNFDGINPYLPNNFNKLLPVLSEVIASLVTLPITHLLIPNITIHEAIDRLSIDLKLLHPLALCVTVLKQKNETSAVVFGTQYTMTSPYLTNYFASEGIQIHSPSEKDRIFIDQFRQKVYSNSETEADKISYLKLLKSYSAKTNIILACTELSVLYDNYDSLNVIDLATLQIEEALNLFKTD